MNPRSHAALPKRKEMKSHVFTASCCGNRCFGTGRISKNGHHHARVSDLFILIHIPKLDFNDNSNGDVVMWRLVAATIAMTGAAATIINGLLAIWNKINL
jgi:hypothetical protein